jgi:hypothetical protein
MNVRFSCRIEQFQWRIRGLRFKDGPRWHRMEFRQWTDIVHVLLRRNSTSCLLEQTEAMAKPSQPLAVIRKERMGPG